MNLKRILTIVFVLIPFAVSAQNLRVVRGAVFNADGVPLPEAKIVHDGNFQGQKVEQDGTFIIQIPYNMKEVTATCEGYLPMTLEVDGSYMGFRLKVSKKSSSKSKQKAVEPANTAPAVKAEPQPAAPVQTTPVQTTPVQTKPEVKEEVKTEPKRVAQPAPVETRPIETKPVEAKPVESKPAVKEEPKKTVAAEAKSAVKEEAKPNAAKAKKAKPASSGLINSFELSYNMQFASGKSVILKNIGHYQYSSVNPIELNYLIGYQFNNWLALSFGTGVSLDTFNLNKLGFDISKIYSDVENYSTFRIPVFINMKTFFTDDKVQPMASLSVGAMSGSVQNFMQDWNMTAELGVGCNFKLGKSNFYALASGKLMPMPVFEIETATSSKVKGSYRSANTFGASIKVGFMF